MTNQERIYGFACEWYGEELVDQQDSSVLILFPEILITNSQYGNSHLIRDMVISLSFSSNGVIRSFKGGRLSFTINELKAKYTHSHIRKNAIKSNGHSLGEFCTGRSGMDGLLATEQWDQYELENFFLFLEHFLSVESQEGIPYNHILNIGTTNLFDSGDLEDSLLTNEVYEEVKELLISRKREFLQTEWDGTKFVVLLTEEAKKYDHYRDISGIRPHERGEGGSTKRVAESIFFSNKFPLDFRFKDVREATIIDFQTENENEEEQSQYYISNPIAASIEARLEEELNKEFFKRITQARRTGWEDQTSDTPYCLSNDKTAVL